MQRTVTMYLSLALLACPAFAELNYQKPPKEIYDILASPPPATISVSHTGDYVVVMQPVRYPPIADVAQPMARIAGLRIDVKTNGLHLAPYYTSLELKRLSDGASVPLSLPKNGKLGSPVWSPDGKHFAVTNTTANGIELWVVATSSGAAKRIEGLRINGVVLARQAGGPPGTGGGRRDRAADGGVEWMPDSSALLVQSIPPGRGSAPPAPETPRGPDIQETAGHAGPAPTFEDLLSSPHDEDLFDYYATSVLARVEIASNRVTRIGKPSIFGSVAVSPDGKALLIEALHKPYSYLLPAGAFPREVEIWGSSGQFLHKVASVPLSEHVPLAGVRTGPRDYDWLPNQSATVVWVEAMDGGNPKEKVPHRDRIVSLSAPFNSEPVEIFKTEERFQGLEPIAKSSKALVQDYSRPKRWVRTFEIDTEKPGGSGRLLFERNQQDRYKDPGRPVELIYPDGSEGIAHSGGTILLDGLGASAAGDHPFLDKFDLQTKKSERLFQSTAGSYEVVEAVLDADGSRFITRRESPSEFPNFYLHTSAGVKPLTAFTDPHPEVKAVKKELINYRRSDGVPLSFILYTPPGYRAGTRLPTLLWAYPLEFNDADTAGQVSGSTDRYSSLSGHLLFALHGYAVLENAAMPIIGDVETVNDTYVKQLVMDAKAAIDKAVEMGVTDPERVGVGGHSYGAFMTANLLAHCNFFHAGMAESGAYNRTLTPFGFQTERRTFWEVPNVYLEMSPFVHAKDIKTPLLMIHGEADDNSGTFPIQSERLYAAIRGNGGVARLVMLPAEAHAYRGLETNAHVLWEELNWMDKHLKGEGASNTPSTATEQQ